jgi:hypothetical protein
VNTDRVKLLSSYGTSVLVVAAVVAATIALLFLDILPVEVGFPALIGLGGAALNFLTGQEAATRAVREYERGLVTPPPPPTDPPA